MTEPTLTVALHREPRGVSRWVIREPDGGRWDLVCGRDLAPRLEHREQRHEERWTEATVGDVLAHAPVSIAAAFRQAGAR